MLSHQRLAIMFKPVRTLIELENLFNDFCISQIGTLLNITFIGVTFISAGTVLHLNGISNCFTSFPVDFLV